jgi:DNA mismatch repair protein MutS2
MNEHTLRVLEYTKVKNIVAAYAASEAGKRAVAGLLPAGDASVVEKLLRETGECTGILLSGERPPLDGVLDIGPAIEKLGASGSTLAPIELLHVAATLGAGRRVKSFFQRFDKKMPGTRIEAPLLCALAARIEPQKHIEDAVLVAIDERAEVKDSASPALRKIRKQVGRMREDILERMSGILQDSGFQKVIQEPVITVRGDRYVLPLKPNFRQSIKGVVHGQSGSLATLFVEPLDVLEQNNRLAELRMEEREEVERILRELTSLLSGSAGAIAETVRALAEIDTIYARARFGLEYNGTIPEISKGRNIRLREMRHPLLVGKSKAAANPAGTTPNDIDLDGGQRVLILSGPNAGGKTVVLKTIGLLSLMAQSGIAITAAEGSELPCFGSIFADIGDEQSLEADLSTFSSHISQLADILRQAGPDSLVLLDELGSGTDPAEGAALGAAVLESLIGRGSLSVVTTHHNALKLFGSQTSGAVNAAMEFDPRTLKPTYRLIPGRPGRSYGLDMAARLGIPDEVIGKARARLDKDDARLDHLLKQVEEDSRELSAERQALGQALTAASRERNEAEAALRAAKEEARDVKGKAKSEAKEILALLRRKLREFSHFSVLEQAEAKKSGVEAEALARKLELLAEEEESPGLLPFRDFHRGDRVRITKLNRTGVVLTTSRGMVELEIDGKKIKLPTSDVAPASSTAREKRTVSVSGWSAEFAEEEGVTGRLNILGLRVDEGLAEVDRFIDRAGLNHLSSVTVIHGLGTGALRGAVTDFLKNHPLVASIRTGEPAEGGAGVTVAELKK